MKQNLILYMLTAALVMAAIVGCKDNNDEGISFWDESYPEEIVEELMDVPAYIPHEVSMYVMGTNKPEQREWYNIIYSYDVDSLDQYINKGSIWGGDSVIRHIIVDYKIVERNKISIGSKVYITASVTNRNKPNPEYLLKHEGINDVSRLIIAPKAYLHQIRRRD